MAHMEPKPCRHCSELFVPAKKTTAFCSRSCQGKWLHMQKILKPKPRLGIHKKCRHCEIDFYVPQYRAETATYCSRRCMALANPERGEKARGNSPIMARKGTNSPRQYKTIVVDGKQIREHRYLMEQHLGRKLESWEHVHHIDGNHLNNDISNLQVLSNSEHQKIELAQWKVKPEAF